MSEVVSKLFAVEAAKWEARYQQKYFQDRRDVLDRWLTKINKAPDSRALDLGCGTFPMEAVFRQHKLPAIGLDASKEMIDLAHGLGRNAQHYSGSDLPFPETAFDCVIMFNVLEFVDNPHYFVTEVSRVSRPNAALLMTFTNFDGLFRRTVRALKQLISGKVHEEPAYMLNQFRYADIKDMLRGVGFGHIHIFRYSWPWAYEKIFSFLPDWVVELLLRNRVFSDCVYVEACRESAA